MSRRILFVPIFLIGAAFSAAPVLAAGDQIGVSAVVPQQRLVYVRNDQIIKIEGNVGGEHQPTFIDDTTGQLLPPSLAVEDQYQRLFYHFGGFAAGQTYVPLSAKVPNSDPFKPSLLRLEYD